MAEPTFDRIEAYLADELSPEDRADFEARCRQDAQWAESTRLHLLARQTLHESGREALKSRLDQRYQPEGSPSATRRPLWQQPWIYAMAAAIALILLLVWWPKSPHYQSPQELYAAYMELPVPSGLRSSTQDSLAQRWEQAMQAFQDSAYQDAIRQLEPLIQDSSFLSQSGNRARLYLGVAHLQLSQFEQAQAYLKSIAAGSLYFDQAQWYRVLAYLRAGQVSPMLPLLHAIAEQENHYRQAQARRLLTQVESLVP